MTQHYDPNADLQKKRKKAVIFDLDNCLSDDRKRVHLIDWGAKTADERYARYHEACNEDPAHNFVVLDGHVRAGRWPVFMTARPVAVREKTRAWIFHRLGLASEEYTLLMRNKDDNRKSAEVKRSQLKDLYLYDIWKDDIDIAYDDRIDILDMYIAEGISATQLKIHDVDMYNPPLDHMSPAQILLHDVGEAAAARQQIGDAAAALEAMAATFRERNAQYKDNYKMVPRLVEVLWPDGVPSKLVVTEQWHLFELILVKLARFAVSDLTHKDSIHDIAVYGAMIDAILSAHNWGWKDPRKMSAAELAQDAADHQFVRGKS